MKNEAEQKFYNKKFIENFVEKTLAKAIFLFFFVPSSDTSGE